MKILGISAFYHDSAAAVIDGGCIIAAAQEERFSRIKHDPAFPAHAVRYCLEESGFSLDELDAVVFYDKPLLKFERLLETYYGFAPRGIGSFLASIPIWVKEKLFLKDLIRKELAQIEPYDKQKLKLLFPEHHLSHAASAFYPCPFAEAAILTIDGVGEWATASLCHGKGAEISILKELRFPHSLGLLYSAFTYFLGFQVNSGEYKVMGLAPYGDPNAAEVQDFKEKITDTLIDLKEDGSLWLNQDYFRYATGLRMVQDKKWEALFGMKRRKTDDLLTQQHSNLALALQQVTEETVIKMARELQRLTGARYLCLAGGVALNCVANGKLQNSGIFEEIFIQPAAGDAGGALGAALAAQHIYFQQERRLPAADDAMQGSCLGPHYAQQRVETLARRRKAPFQQFEEFEELCEETARLLAQGKVLGWHQGRMEYGPRALGNRSILADARNPAMQQTLNLKIKYRESFRPFAPAVLAEDAHLYFDLKGPSRYMLLVQEVVKERRKPLPEGYQGMSLREKLTCERSDIPAVTHCDFSARIQTVSPQSNPRFYQLLKAFKQQTGQGILVNTSFNVKDEPIVCTPEDAYRCFMETEMDFLVIGNLLFDKTQQPAWNPSKTSSTS